jgi:hypothetical protein
MGFGGRWRNLERNMSFDIHRGTRPCLAISSFGKHAVPRPTSSQGWVEPLHKKLKRKGRVSMLWDINIFENGLNCPAWLRRESHERWITDCQLIGLLAIARLRSSDLPIISRWNPHSYSYARLSVQEKLIAMRIGTEISVYSLILNI